jgi:hypothetical protein
MYNRGSSGLVSAPVARDAGTTQRYWIGVAGNGLHLEKPGEDISVEGLLAGRGDMSVRRPHAA